MLTPVQFREICDVWRPRFHNEELFEKSAARLLELVGDPTPEKAHNWFAKDQAKDELLHTAAPREPLLPTRQELPSGCYHCHGMGYVRAPSWSPDPSECGPSHPGFGKAVRCPACSNPHHRCEHCTP